MPFLDGAVVAELRLDPDGGAPTFVPLSDAREAVAAARAQERVDEFDAEALSRAEASLAEAQSSWDKIADRVMRVYSESKSIYAQHDPR